MSRSSSGAGEVAPLHQRVLVVAVTSIVAEFIWRRRQYLLDFLIMRESGFLAYILSSVIAYSFIFAGLFGIGQIISRVISTALSGKQKKRKMGSSSSKEKDEAVATRQKNENGSTSSKAPSSPKPAAKIPDVSTAAPAVVESEKSATKQAPEKEESPSSPGETTKGSTTGDLSNSQDFAEIDAVLLGNREEPGAFERVQQQLEAMERTGPVLARLAQITYWIGEFAESKAEKDEIFTEAVRLGQEAVKKAPDCFEARFWYAVSMGSHAQVKGMMKSAQYLTPLTEHAEWAYKAKPEYFQGGPCRLWGGVLLDSPPWPIAVGDKKKALRVLQQGIELGPDFPQNYLLLARAYYANGDKANALEALRELSSQRTPSINAGFHGKMRWEAQDLIAQYSKDK